jgi:hypothetical protein
MQESSERFFPLTHMETFEPEPQVLANRRGVSFYLARQDAEVECVVPLRVLAQYFWLEPGASEVQVLTTFRNGYGRIHAISERKLRAHPVARLDLTIEDFARP